MDRIIEITVKGKIFFVSILFPVTSTDIMDHKRRTQNSVTSAGLSVSQFFKVFVQSWQISGAL